MKLKTAVLVSCTLLVLLAIGGWAQIWGPAIGNLLVRSDAPGPADIIVTLAGDTDGGRVMKAARLAQDGLAPRVLVGGAGKIYGQSECTLAAAFAVDRGFPSSMFEPFCFTAESTLQEARILDAELQSRGASKVIIVTNDYHIRRVRLIYSERLSTTIYYSFVSCKTPQFTPDAWWTTRFGKKTVLLEFLKLIHSWFERPS